MMPKKMSVMAFNALEEFSRIQKLQHLVEMALEQMEVDGQDLNEAELRVNLLLSSYLEGTEKRFTELGFNLVNLHIQLKLLEQLRFLE